jgi:hypothetical protein
MVKYRINLATAIGVGLAMVSLAGCAPTTHVTETTTTRQYDTSNPPMLAPVPVASANTTTTTRYNNGTVEQTSTQPTAYAPAGQSTTTVTTDPIDGVQKQTTTTYTTP